MTDLTPYVGEIIKNTTLQLCQALAERDHIAGERDAAIAERDQARGAVETLTKQISDLAKARASAGPVGYGSDGEAPVSPPIG